MILKRLAVLAAVAGALLAVSSANPTGDAAMGKEVFLKKCKTCHGEDGSGNQGMAKLLKTTIPPMGSDEVQGKSDADMKKIITEGMGKMRPVKDLSDTEIDNVIAYVRTFKKK